MSDFLAVSRKDHDALVATAFLKRGFKADEVAPGTYLCAEAARHGIRPHIALRALYNDHYFGSKHRWLHPRRRSRSRSVPLPGLRDLERQQKVWSRSRLPRHRPRHRARQPVWSRPNLRRQCLALPLGCRLRDGRRRAGLHRLHPRHLSSRRGRSPRRQPPHLGHQSPLLGLPHFPCARISTPRRLDHLQYRHVSCRSRPQ